MPGSSPDDTAFSKEQESVIVGTDASNLRLEDALKCDSVVVFGKSTCPFCTEVVRTLDQRITNNGQKYVYYRLDKIEDGAALHAQLKEKTKQTTVPYVFVNGQLIGGCSDVKTGDFNGTAASWLGALTESGVAAAKQMPARLPSALFLFPNTVDARIVRLTGALVCLANIVIAIMGVVDKTYEAARWMALANFVDFILRFFAGSNASALGSLAVMLVGVGQRLLGTKATFRAGPPKQFAQLVGCMFSGLGALFFFLGPDQGDWARWLGFAWLVGLAGAAGLEGFANFCAGCLFFSYGVRFGAFPASIYGVHTSELPDIIYTWVNWNARLNEGPPPVGTKKFHTRKTESKIDPVWKEKTDDMRRESYHFVRHFHVMYWSMPLALSALAVVFLFATKIHDVAPMHAPQVPSLIWKILAGVAGVNWTVFFVLQLARIVVYPKKVYKEWVCPVRSNAFVFPTICLLLFVRFALEADERGLAKALFWAAGPLQLAVCVRVVSLLMYYLTDPDAESPVWLAIPLSNVLAAVAYSAIYKSPISQTHLAAASQLWMGFAVLIFLAIFPTAIRKLIMGHNQEVSSRAAHWMVCAAAAVLGAGWQMAVSPDELSAVFVMCYFGSIILLATLLYGIYPMRFHCSGRWHMGMWAIGFTFSAMALASLVFNSYARNSVSEVMQIVSMAMAALSNWILLMHFGRDVFTYKVFVEDKPHAPLMFLKLTHEAFRGLMERIKNTMKQTKMSKPESVRALLRLWDDYCFLNRVHMHHEDEVMFPRANEWWPHHADPFSEEHEEDHKRMAELTPLFRALHETLPPPNFTQHGSELFLPLPSNSEPAQPPELEALFPKLTSALDSFEQHLTHEEMRLSPVMRKTQNMRAMRHTLQEVWKSTDTLDMFRFIPVVINNIRHHPQRLAFVRMFLWAMPERCKQIGIMLALGIDPVMWQRLADEIPDIIPRGMSGWHRQ